VLLLLVTAYGFGRIFFSEVAETDTSTQEPDGVVIDDDGASPSGDQQPSKAPEKKYDGRVDPVAIGGASASCQADSGVDATGRRVDYDPSKVHDGDMTSAWRCDGSGVGERVTIDLPEQVTIGEVGLVAGYAKTDPRSGADRYAENNRITRVRWVFSDGSSVTQKLDGSATNRDLQTVRIPRTEADRVVIEILSSRRGPRDTVAISEVGLGAVVG